MPILVIVAGAMAFTVANNSGGMILAVIAGVCQLAILWSKLQEYGDDFLSVKKMSFLGLFLLGELVIFHEGVAALGFLLAMLFLLIFNGLASVAAGTLSGIQEKFINLPTFVGITLMILGLGWFWQRPRPDRK